MAQQIINTGAAANDGTGDPLRTAFTETNNNFTEIYTAGPVGSNVQIVNNTILTLNTNGNLVLAPNGTGRVVANVDVVPNRANVRNLGSSSARWSTVYTQYLNVTNSTTVAGDLTVGGNLIVTGNTVQIGNLVTDAKTLQLANTAANANAATGSGITVGANDDIATLLYSSTGNVWTTNIGVSAVGNVTAPYFFGNGSQLTGLPVPYGNANVVTLLAGFGSNTISTTGNVSGGYLFGNGSQLTGLPVPYGNANVVTLLAGFGSNTVSTSGNVTAGNVLTGSQVIANGVIQTGTGFSTGGYLSVNGATDLHDTNIIGTLSVNVIQSDDSTVVKIQDGAEIDGDTLVNGNVTADYFIGNGSQLTGISTANTGNVTFNDVNIVGTGNLNLQPTSASNEYLNIYLTGAADIHVAAGGTGGNVILGTDEEANIAVLQGGNVAIQAGNVAGTKTWTFDTAGNLTLPMGSIVYETNIPDGALSGSAIALKPTGGTTANQQLLIYPTANDGDHIHMTSGNLYTTELFLGSDNFYVKLANTGNVVINSNDGNSSNAMWTFGTDGSLTLPIGVSIDNSVDPLYPKIIADSGKLFSVQGQGNTGSAALAWTVNPDAASQYAAVAVNRAGDNLAKVILQAQSDSGNVETVKLWKFDETGNLTLPTGGNLIVSGSIVSSGASPAPSINGFSSINSITLSASGNVTGAFIKGNGSELTNLPAPSVAQDITSTGDMSIMTYDGNLKYVNNATVEPATGSIKTAGNISATGNITGGNIITAGNVTAQNFIGNISITGNVQGTSANVTLVAGSYSTVFDNTGNLTLPGNTFAVNYANNTPVPVVTRVESSWTVPVGNSTQSFTVPINNTYQLWVNSNIPNGIIVWNATVSVSNTNVPAIGYQYAWNYEGGGNILMLTSIPNQIIGTAGAISNAQPAVANTNVFSFGINNASGNAVTVNYGWIQIS